MYKKVLLITLVLGLVSPALAAYITVTVPNGSFELPGNDKQGCWDGENEGATDLPGWSSDFIPSSSGIEKGFYDDGSIRFGATDGVWTAYMRSGDVSVWNLLPYVIQSGDEFMLSVDLQRNDNTPGCTATLTMSLYYHDEGGERIQVATQDVTVTSAGQGTPEGWQTYSLSYTAAGDAIGHKLGIELSGSGGG